MAEEKTMEAAPTPEQAAVSTLEGLSSKDSTASAAPSADVTGSQPAGATDQATGEEDNAAQDTRDASKPTLTDKQRAAAKHLGYSDADVADMTPRELSQMERESARERKWEQRVGRLQQQLKGKQAEGSDDPDGQQGGDDDQQEKSAGEGDEPAAESKAGADAPKKPKRLNPDASWEDAVTAMNSTLDYAERLEQRLAVYESAAQEAVKAQKAQEAKEVGEFFGKLDGDIYGETYGQGEVEPGSPEHRARKELESFARFLRGFRRQHGAEKSLADCLNDALVTLAKDQYTKAVLKGADRVGGKKSAGWAQRPSGSPRQPEREPTGLTPEQEAVRELERRSAG